MYHKTRMLEFVRRLVVVLIALMPTAVTASPQAARPAVPVLPAAETPSPGLLFPREAGILHAASPHAGDQFGYTVAVSGDTAAVGAPFDDTMASDGGAVHVFQRSQGLTETWQLVTTLHGAQAGAWFGFSLAMQGDTIVVGADYYDLTAAVDAGAALVFERDQGGPSAWGLTAMLQASDFQAYDHFGRSVAIDGDTIVVGAIHADCDGCAQDEDSGATYVFQRDLGGPNHWGQSARLRASDAQSLDRFGSCVAISVDTISSAAAWEDGGPGDPITDTGEVYIFYRDQGGVGNWGQVTSLHASDAEPYDRFGFGLDVEGDTLVVGAFREDGGPGNPLPDSGAAYVHYRDQGGADAWGEVTVLRASDALWYDYFGSDLELSSDLLVVNAYLEDGGPGDPSDNAGAAYLFERDQGGADHWGEAGILHASDAQAGDRFGLSVGISGDTVVSGAALEDGGSGDPVQDAGAGYIYRLMEPAVFLPLINWE